MVSQQADAKEELLLELTSKNTTRSIKDFSPEGIRLESNLEGEATAYTPPRSTRRSPCWSSQIEPLTTKCDRPTPPATVTRSSCTTRGRVSSRAPPTINSWAKPSSRPHQR